ncbi:hypothetical protein M8542_41900 [Amycolatopsis sp. OK19-0408]|uniref:Uncharacterized protein n=1 Tax=Amycolatopsis iheyensis TaxID=2945988 RepID=A0A9X2NIG0_9PSEU|nr:hypothetical protein [Amycolatopsis iheyensis]MCR6489391.1 hypothetical protein [Amycolatopsis iheyensis]
MASWDDVGRIARGLPEVAEDSARGHLAWQVGKKGFAWERPLRKGDVEALGARAPTGPVLCAYVPDVGVEAWLCRAPKRLAKTWVENRQGM